MRYKTILRMRKDLEDLYWIRTELIHVEKSPMGNLLDGNRFDLEDIGEKERLEKYIKYLNKKLRETEASRDSGETFADTIYSRARPYL